MSISMNGPKQVAKSKAESLFIRADQLRDSGDLRSAFRLFLAAAKAGDKAAQLNVGYCYDTGSGTRPNRAAALYWYKRAYRRGDPGGAKNIGTILRDEHEPQRALSWFKRAVKLGDDGSNLEIAKLYFQNERNPSKAIAFLEKVCKSNRVTEGELEQAKQLMKRAKRQLTRTGAAFRR
jgi:TPR repeat protein